MRPNGNTVNCSVVSHFGAVVLASSRDFAKLTYPQPFARRAKCYHGLRMMLRLTVASGLLMLVIGCNRAAPPAPRNDHGPPPREVVASLIAAHRQRSYAAIELLCHPLRVSEVISTLTAVDDFLAANDELCEMVRMKVSGGAARVIDQSRIASNLDIFSAYVELRDERIDGDNAVVTYTVDGKVPVRETRLVRCEGRWRYDPGEGYRAEIPAAFQRMADGLRLVSNDLRSGRISATKAAEDPQMLIEEVRLRLLPGLQMLPQPGTTKTAKP